MKNTFRVLMFSGLVTLFWTIIPHAARAATIYASPGSGTYTVGQTIVVTIRIDAQGQAINASEGTITWTNDTLQFKSLSDSGSIFKYWPIDPVVRGSTTAIYSGGLPSPGYAGSAGTIFRLTFVTKAAGTAKIQVSGAKILANDGSGTDVYTGQGAGSFTIKNATVQPTPPPVTPSVPDRPTPTISSSSHPDSNTWYTATNIIFAWSQPSGFQGVSYEVTHEAGTIPDDSIDSTGKGSSFTAATDGVWYIHVRGKYPAGWSSTAHFAVRVDHTPPEAFTPTVKQDRGSNDPTPELDFSTTDATSGIASYSYRIDNQPNAPATSPVILEDISPGDHTIVVTATDQAGNIREGTTKITTTGYPSPTITSVSSPLVLLDPLIVRGVANAGDTISVYVGQELIGQVVAGPADSASTAAGVQLRVPWALTSDRLFRPGTYTLTATATSQAGQVSAPTDPKSFHVVGQALLLNGRPVATLSVVAPVGFLILMLFILILVIIARGIVAIWVMHRRANSAEEDLEALRSVNDRQTISRQQLDSAIEQIEEDLEGRARQTPAHRRPSKRSR